MLRNFTLGRRIASLREAVTRIVIGGWLRELFTLGVTADVYAGVPALYVNFVDYDVAAHALGPRHHAALRALRGVDRSIERIARVARRVPGLDYDLFVLSDHGQIRSLPFHEVAGEASVASMIRGCFGAAALGAEEPSPPTPPPMTDVPRDADPPMPLWPFVTRRRRGFAAVERQVRERNAVWVGGLCVVPAGPNANVYLTHTPDRVPAEEIEARYPGALLRLSRHAAIGFVLARDAEGPVCYYRGAVFRIPPASGPTGCPVFDRPDRDVVVRGLQDLLAMPSGGDVILYGHYAPAGCVSFLGERGSHAGPSEDELYAFLAAPPGVAADLGAVARARDLHSVFARYHRPAVEGGSVHGGAAAGSSDGRA